MVQSVRILMTCAGGATIPYLAAALTRSRDLQISISACDANPLTGRSAEAFPDADIVPAGRDPGYAAAVLELAQQKSADLVWPGSDEEALALSVAKPLFERAGMRLLVSDAQCLRLLTDKAEVYRRLSAAGIACPDYSIARGYDDLKRALSLYGFPRQAVVVKPTTGRGGRGVVVLCGLASVEDWIGGGARETRAAGADVPDALRAEIYPDSMMVMPIMGGPVYDADICAVRGEPRAVSLRKRHNPTGIPYRGNLVFRDESLERLCGDIARTLELDSLHDYDMMTDRNGAIRLLEVNPRPSGSFISTVAAGANLAEVAIAAKMGFALPYRPIAGAVEVSFENGVLAARPAE